MAMTEPLTGFKYQPVNMKETATEYINVESSVIFENMIQTGPRPDSVKFEIAVKILLPEINSKP